MVIFDSDCGSEFINHEVAAWLRARDVEQTRSRPYQKNDQAHVESKNNHVVRKHAFYRRYDTAAELELLGRLWRLVFAEAELLHPDAQGRGLRRHGGRPQEAHLRQAQDPMAARAGIRCA
jgi:transposase InsO family protein